MRAGRGIASLIVVSALVGCGTSAPTRTVEESEFLDYLRAKSVTDDDTDARWLGLGHRVCDQIGAPGFTRDDAVRLVGEAGPLPGTAVVDSAETHLCGGKRYSLTDEQAFVADVRDTPGLTATVADADLVQIGQMICGMVGDPGVSRESIQLVIASTRFGPTVGSVLVDAAQRNLCVGKPYSAGIATAPVQAPPVTPTTITGEVGNATVGQEIEPGTYTTAGGDTCYWAVISKGRDGQISDIKNRLGGGPQKVTLRAGQDFQSLRCGTWTKTK